MERKKLELIMSVLMILCAFALAERGWKQTLGEHVTGNTGKKCVVIDAGHGGNDPGKIGVDDSREKDLNLIIADKVKRILEQQDIDVIMTRETDVGLYEEDASNKKVQDLKKRVSIINENQPDCVISIHQNSMPDHPSVHGAQAFYNAVSPGGELGVAVQGALNGAVNVGNEKNAKAIDSTIYLMKNVRCPAILIECGFLSNPAETQLLLTDEYQVKLAACIAAGLLQYHTEGAKA